MFVLWSAVRGEVLSRARVLGAPVVSSDGFQPYADAVCNAFAPRLHYGQIIKTCREEPRLEAARRYSPGVVAGVNRQVVCGQPAVICTSHVERANLSVRMASRRLTRLSNGFSKKIANHAAAVSLYVAHYNFCRVHETIRTTPALALGVTDHVWSIAHLIKAALDGVVEPEGRRAGRFRVIEGGGR